MAVVPMEGGMLAVSSVTATNDNHNNGYDDDDDHDDDDAAAAAAAAADDDDDDDDSDDRSSGMEWSGLRWGVKGSSWFHGVAVSTQDSESCDPSSNLGGTW